MSETLYTPEILRLTTSLPQDVFLSEPHGVSERRSPICGSRVMVEVLLDGEGHIVALGHKIRACAFGQASAALMMNHAIGRNLTELTASRDALAGFLAGQREDPGDWPGIDMLSPARSKTARHASIMLAFEAVTEAVERAAVIQGATQPA